MATNVTYMLGIDAGASAGFAGAGWVWPYPVADRHSCAPGLAVGYVPQRLAVSHTLPLSLRRLMKLTAPFPAREIDAALAAVGLDRLGHPPVTSLSGGELQRLLLAGALIHRPDLLVLDEPAQGVDIAGAGVLHELIEGIRSDLGCGILLISHDLQMVMNSDSVVVVLLPHEHDDSPFGAAAAAQSAEHRERTGSAVAMLDDFLFRALLAGVGLALVTGPAGCFVVWRHLSYFGETIAHSAMLGVVLSVVLQIDLVVGIFVCACLVTLLMFYLQGRGTLPADTVLGLLAHGGMATGLAVLAFFPTVRIDLQALLFGDILAVSRTGPSTDLGGRRPRAGGDGPDLAATPRRHRSIPTCLRCRTASGADAPHLRPADGHGDLGRHQNRRHPGDLRHVHPPRLPADRRSAGHPARYRSPLCRQPRADGPHRRCGRRRRDSRRSVRLGSPGHLFRPSIVVAALLLFAVTRFRRPQLAPRSRS